MMARNILPIIFLTLSALAFTSCTQSGDELIAGDNTQASNTKDPNVVYDTRFPFPVWTDEFGEMHFDIDIDNCDAPTHNELMANIVGKGLMLDKNYCYREIGNSTDGYTPTLDVLNFITVVGGDANPRFFIDSDTKATIFYMWKALPGTVPDEELDVLHHSIENIGFSYDGGKLNLHFLGKYKVIKTTPEELWLGYESEFMKNFIRYIVVAREEVELWHKLYTDPQ